MTVWQRFALVAEVVYKQLTQMDKLFQSTFQPWRKASSKANRCVYMGIIIITLPLLWRSVFVLVFVWQARTVIVISWGMIQSAYLFLPQMRSAIAPRWSSPHRYSIIYSPTRQGQFYFPWTPWSEIQFARLVWDVHDRDSCYLCKCIHWFAKSIIASASSLRQFLSVVECEMKN